ncbi:GtrA family protein [Jidongwangia harbinensis]|uniref:GtrA family protein n=1 Tax=Jidongwangia harbinensis TaxID=2878561 RepID=UPI001CD9A7FC|nr:GtrA family protein [Jidongwangia harbinensis]MCA2217895.1 GtrA family protein [Jidongwangia harbinensis]
MLAALAADRRVRYVFAGSTGALLFYALFTVGWLTVSRWVPYLVIATVASTLTAIGTYPLYRSVVFRATGPLLAGFLRFYLVCLWALVFSLGGLWALVEVGGLHPLLAQAVIIVLGPLINYQASRLWAFRPLSGS